MEKWDCGIKMSPLSVTSTVSPDEGLVSVDSSSTFTSLTEYHPPSSQSLSQLPNMERSDGMAILFCSPSILNLNFSKQMLSTLLRTVRTWTAEIQSDADDGEESHLQNIPPRKKKSDHSYYIRNLTGFNVYWTAYKEKERHNEPNIQVLPDNTQQSLSSAFRRSGRRIGAAVENRKNVVDNVFASMEVEYVTPPTPVTSGGKIELEFTFIQVLKLIFLEYRGGEGEGVVKLSRVWRKTRNGRRIGGKGQRGGGRSYFPFLELI